MKMALRVWTAIDAIDGKSFNRLLVPLEIARRTDNFWAFAVSDHTYTY